MVIEGNSLNVDLQVRLKISSACNFGQQFLFQVNSCLVSRMGNLPAFLRPSSRVRVAHAQEESYQPSRAGDGLSEVGDHAKPRRDIDGVSLSESVDQRAAEDDVRQRRIENESHRRADPPTHASDVSDSARTTVRGDHHWTTCAAR